MNKRIFKLIIILPVILTALLMTGYATKTINPFKSWRIPILAYHCVDDKIFGSESLFVSPVLFEKHMEYLKQQGYTPITFRDMKNISKIKKPIMITFDDGYENNYTYAFPILQKYNFKATIFLISNLLETHNYLTAAQINEMKSLIDFESHTNIHPKLTELSPEELDQEFKASNDSLKSLLGRDAIALAYPYGKYNLTVEKAAQKQFKYAVGLRHGYFYYGFDKQFEIPRIIIYHDTSLERFQLLLNKRR